MSKTELAYLAGMFDGEGCMSVCIRRRTDRKGISFGLIFLVINTCRDVTDWCLEKIGAGCVVFDPVSKVNRRRKPCFSYRLDKHHVMLHLLPAMLPFMMVRQPQVSAALRFVQSRSTRPRRVHFNTIEIDALFDIRLHNHGPTAPKGCIIYKGRSYNREAFQDLVRNGRDLSAYKVVEWTPEMDSLVGTDIDRRVAARLGFKLAQVQRRREALGIPPFGSIHEDVVRQILQLRSEKKTQPQIAEALHISQSSVNRTLKSHGHVGRCKNR